MITSTPKKELDWWLVIVTQVPCYIYYFGPFRNAWEAEHHTDGYLEDLILEGAQGLWLIAQQCQPTMLTIKLSPEQLGPFMKKQHAIAELSIL
jgi:hypothetical protein